MNREIDGQLRIHLEKEFGSIERIQPQVGMGYGHVVTISTKRCSFVLKLSPRPNERIFYRELSRYLATHDICTPKLYADGLEDGVHWIAIEYLLQSLPKKRWRTDDEVLRTLARMTQVTRIHIALVIICGHLRGLNHIPPKVVEYYQNGFPRWVFHTFGSLTET